MHASIKAPPSARQAENTGHATSEPTSNRNEQDPMGLDLTLSPTKIAAPTGPILPDSPNRCQSFSRCSYLNTGQNCPFYRPTSVFFEYEQKNPRFAIRKEDFGVSGSHYSHDREVPNSLSRSAQLHTRSGMNRHRCNVDCDNDVTYCDKKMRSLPPPDTACREIISRTAPRVNTPCAPAGCTLDPVLTLLSPLTNHNRYGGQSG